MKVKIPLFSRLAINSKRRQQPEPSSPPPSAPSSASSSSSSSSSAHFSRCVLPEEEEEEPAEIPPELAEWLSNSSASLPLFDDDYEGQTDSDTDGDQDLVDHQLRISPPVVMKKKAPRKKSTRNQNKTQEKKPVLPDVVVLRKLKRSQLQPALDSSEVLKQKELHVKELVEVFNVTAEEAWAACGRYGWDLERVYEHFMEAASSASTETEDHEEEQEEDQTNDELQGEEAAERFDFLMTCQICCNEVSIDFESLKLPACPEAHRFCRDCWKAHATSLVTEGRTPILCMGFRCGNHLNDLECLRSLLSTEVFELCQYLMATNFVVKSGGKMRWCPSPSCQKAVVLSEGQTCTEVRCACGTPFCASCGNEWHSPIDCESYRRWCDKCTSEGESTKWIINFTRPCPNVACQRPIEKNGGCPHMQCKGCQSHFCWTCMQLYVNGSHKCLGEKSQAKKTESDIADLTRYRDAYVGFDGCIMKEKNLNILLQDATRKMLEYRELNSEQWNETTPFEDAVWTYFDHLRTLRFTFVLCYFAQEDNTPDQGFLGFLLKEFQDALHGLEKQLSSTGVTRQDLEQLKKATHLVNLKSRAVIAAAKEGVALNADLYRLNGEGKEHRKEGEKHRVSGWQPWSKSRRARIFG